MYDPEGMLGSAKTTFTPALVKSASDVMPFGLPWAMIISKLLVVKLM